MQRRIEITADMSRDTDLADQLLEFQEFVGGEGYEAQLCSFDGSQRVTVGLVESADEASHVAIIGQGSGDLFTRVLGVVVQAMVANSDHLMVHRIEQGRG